MNRFVSYSLFALVLGVTSLSLLSGCGRTAEVNDDGEGRVERRKKSGGKTQLAELPNPTNGTLKGKVVFDGTPPEMEPIASMADHADKAVCLMGKEFEKRQQAWIIGEGKGVANVVIRLQAPEGMKFKEIDPETPEVTIDQPHCAFIPHVAALKPKQSLKVLNSAPIPHNTNIAADPIAGNIGKNVTLAPGSSTPAMSFNAQKQPLQLSCQFHPWMNASVYVSDSPYIVVTKADGSFEMKNVPTGVSLKLIAIHPSGKVEPQAIQLEPGEKTIELKISAAK